MSITRDHGEIVFECDSPNCLEFIDTDTESWEVAKSVFDRRGWVAELVNGEWHHYCDECKRIW